MRASSCTHSSSAFDAGRSCDAVEPHRQRQHQHEEMEMQELITSIDASHAQLTATTANDDCVVAADRWETKLPCRQQQSALFSCPYDAQPKLLLLRPEPDDGANLSCWQFERRRQATYRVLFGRPLVPPTLSPAATYASAASSHKIASPLVQQATKASKAASGVTAKPSRKRKPPKPKASSTRTPERLCTTQAKRIAVEDELCPMKEEEEKLSLIDQILFGDGNSEFVLEDNEADFTDAEWLSMNSDVKTQLGADGEEDQEVSGVRFSSTELLLEESESDQAGSGQLSSILSLDFLKSLDEGDEEQFQEPQDEEEDQEAASDESSSPLDSSLLDDLLGASGCGDGGPLEFAL
ncbi:hypothetical protein Gpo141_00009246 [Globisporangium polare]